jgi:hypothetical protein
MPRERQPGPPRATRTLRACRAPLVALLLLAGCVHFVADYDEQIDRGISQVLSEFEAVFTRLDRADGAEGALYPNYVKDYDGIRTELRGLRSRAAAHAKNDLTIQQIDLLLDTLDKMEALQKLGPLSSDQLAVLRRSVETSCTAILKLELAKKRPDTGT